MNGLGTQISPWEIVEYSDLQKMGNGYDTTDDKTYLMSEYYQLQNDITVLEADPDWVPIGDDTTDFSGELDGQGFTVDGLQFNILLWSGSPRGLFYCSITGVVKDLTLKNISFEVRGNGSPTGLATRIKGVVNNVHITGDIILPTAAFAPSGGFSPGLTGDLIDSSFEGTIGGSTTSGGFVSGLIANITEGTGRILGCFSSGSTSSPGGSGGLVGYVGATGNPSAEIKNSYSQMTLNGTLCGGCIATIGGEQDFVIENLYYAGITSNPSIDGGIVASVTNTSGSSIVDSFWDSSIGPVSSVMGASKTTSEMKAIATFDPEWDIVDCDNYVSQEWCIEEGVEYPTLGWEVGFSYIPKFNGFQGGFSSLHGGF